MKLIYFKVYQDKHSIRGNFFIETIDNCLHNINEWVRQCEEDGDHNLIFEPVLMTEEEFENLPKFNGY